jgi:hypothetical protein
MNARDLSEPPNNGTTSGCPPPSQHHNYRRTLHTQQRNRFERGKSARFWMGVAQIARSRDRNLIASICFITVFLDSSIWRANCCCRAHYRWFPLGALQCTPNRTSGATNSPRDSTGEPMQAEDDLAVEPRSNIETHCSAAIMEKDFAARVTVLRETQSGSDYPRRNRRSPYFSG